MDPRRARLRYTVLVAAFGASIAAASAACVFSTPNVSAEQEQCSVLGTFLGSCSSSPASCSSAVTTDCSQVTSTLSDALLNGMLYSEQNGLQCDAGSVLTSPSALENVGAASVVQAQLATDFCARCEPGSTTCNSSFYDPGGIGLTDAPAFAAADDIVTTIDRTCVSPLSADAGAAACTAAFVACARPILSAQLFLPPACTGNTGVLPPLAWTGVARP